MQKSVFLNSINDFQSSFPKAKELKEFIESNSIEDFDNFIIDYCNNNFLSFDNEFDRFVLICANEITDKKFLSNLDGIEVEISFANHPRDKRKITEVRLKLTPEEWVDLLDPDGELLPSCCSTISHIRDLLSKCLRHGRWISPYDLKEIIENFEYHNEHESHNESEENFDFIGKLKSIWNRIKPYIDFENETFVSSKDKINKDIDILYHCSGNLILNEHCARPNKALISLHRNKIFPIIKKIYDSISSVAEEYTGVAILNENKEILVLTHGLAIFDSFEDANELATEILDFCGKDLYITDVKITLEGELQIDNSNCKIVRSN